MAYGYVVGIAALDPLDVVFSLLLGQAVKKGGRSSVKGVTPSGDFAIARGQAELGSENAKFQFR